MKFLKKINNNYINILKILFLLNIFFIIATWFFFNFEYFKIISLFNIILGFLFIIFYLKNKREHIPVPEVLFFTVSIGFSFLPAISFNSRYAEFLVNRSIFFYSQFYENIFNPVFQFKVQSYIFIILLSSLIIWEFLLKNFKFQYNFLLFNKNSKLNIWKYIFWINIFILIFFNLLGYDNFNFFFQNIILIIGNYFFFIIKDKYKLYYFILTIVVATLYLVIISFVISLILVFIVSLKKRDSKIFFYVIILSIFCILLKPLIGEIRSKLVINSSDYNNKTLIDTLEKKYGKDKSDIIISELINYKKNKLSFEKRYETILENLNPKDININKVIVLSARLDYSFITARIFRLKEIDGIEKNYKNLLPILSKFRINKFENYKENFTNYIGRQLQIFDELDLKSSLNLTFINCLFYSFDNFAIALIIIFLVINSMLALILLKNFENNYEIFFVIVPLLSWEKNFSLYYGDIIKGFAVFLLFFLTKKIIQNIYFFRKYFY